MLYYGIYGIGFTSNDSAKDAVAAFQSELTKGLSNRFCAHKDIWRAGCMVFGKRMMQNSYNHIITPAGVTELHFVVKQLKKQQLQVS